MNLEQNLYDTVREWQLKLGYQREEMRLYYPEESLLELLDTTKETLPEAAKVFAAQMADRLGSIQVMSTEKKDGRWCVCIPPEGVTYVWEHVPEPAFLKAFLTVLKTPGATLSDVEQLFVTTAPEQARSLQTEPQAKGFWFADGQPDPYVYHVEVDDFGLEYHRFTRKSYEALFGNTEEYDG